MTHRGWTLALGCSLLASLGGCLSPSSPVPSAEESSPVPAVARPSASPSASAPPVTDSLPGARLVGTVLQRLDGGNYTYLELQQADGTVWAAVPRCEVSRGEKVTVERAMPLSRFHSPTLGRDFATIYFGVLKGAQTKRAGRPSPPPQAVPSSIAIAKPRLAGAYSVAEIIREAGQLAGETVHVRAMVVKASGEILGRNWVHLQDGSGSPDTGDHDILVTTVTVVQVGSVVDVTGTVVVDKSFGVGAPFPLLVEASSVRLVHGV